MKTNNITYAGVLCAAAVVLGYIESLIPPFIPVAGFKIGLSNLAVMFALYKLGTKQAFFVMLIKVLVTCLLFSGASALLFSLFGGAAAFFAMCTARRLKLSHCGVGVCGGVFHNLGQLLAAFIVMGTHDVFLWTPALLVLGTATGFLIGAAARLVLNRFVNN